MILLLGGSGYVGGAYQALFQSKKISFRSLSRSEVDYSRPEVLRDFLRQNRPDFLLNAAGYTGKPNVDASEDQKLNCLMANAVLPGVIAEVCESEKIPWGHVSSGCIFLGAKPDGSGFTEEDAPNFSFRTNNCSFYSGTKALGEEILAAHKNCYIWRLRIPFNEVDNDRNYLSKLMKYERLVDVRNSISQLDEFVRATWECWEKRVPFGTYNVTNPGSITTREVAAMIEKHGLARHAFQFFKNEAEFMQKAAKTPRASCVMDSSKLLKTGIHLTEVHEALEWALKNWKKQ